jgi:zinc transporter 9
MTPIGAILIYVFVTIANTSNQFIVAILFLFSAGTFLYVIHHVMAEIASRKNDGDFDENSHCKSSLSAIEFLISVAGVCIPIIFSFFDDT